MNLFRKAVSGLTACVMCIGISNVALALENPSDTVFGTLPSSAYILNELQKGKRSIEVPSRYFEGQQGGLTRENATASYYEAVNQSPYLFHSTSFKVTLEGDKALISRQCYYNEAQEMAMMNATEKEAERIVDSIINDYMTDLDKMKAVYNYVSNAATYDWDACAAITAPNFIERMHEWVDASSSYGCLIVGKAVCSGYAQAFNLLARKAGLTSLSVTGTDYELNHIWNRCWADGQWYEVDSCNKILCNNADEYKQLSGMSLSGKAISSNGAEYMGF